MRLRRELPATADISASPELGVLALLETALDLVLISLVAAYPDDEPDAEDLPAERRAARGIVSAIGALFVALDRYELALARARERDRDERLPF